MGGSRLDELLRLGRDLRWQRRLEEAVETFSEAVRVAEADNDERRLADALVWLGIVKTIASVTDADLTHALSLQQRALTIETKRLGEGSPRVAETLRTIASTLGKMNRRAEAIESLRKATAIFHEAGTNSQEVEDAFAELADLLCDSADFAAAIDVAKELVALTEHRGDPLRTGMAHFTLGRILVGANRGSEAVSHLERVLDLAAPRIAAGRAARLTAEIEAWLHRARERDV